MKATINALRYAFSYKYNRLLQEMGIVVRKPLGKPSLVFVKITHRCLTQCVMCNIWRRPSRPADELSTSQWKTVLSDLRLWLGPYHIIFIGGEPFARRDLAELFSHCTKIGLHSICITRGIGVYDEQTASQIITSGLNEYHVSIEGLDPQIHDALSPPRGSFAKAFAGVNWLNTLRRRQGSPLKIVIKTIIMGTNCDQILPIMDWVLREGFDEIKFQPLEQTIEEEKDPNWFKHSNLWPKDNAAVHKLVLVIEKLIELKRGGAPIYNSELDLTNMKRYFLDPVGMSEPIEKHAISTTGTEWETSDGHLEIWHDGEVKTSWNSPPIGKVTESPISKIWKARPVPPKVVRVFSLLR